MARRASGSHLAATSHAKNGDGDLAQNDGRNDQQSWRNSLAQNRHRHGGGNGRHAQFHHGGTNTAKAWQDSILDGVAQAGDDRTRGNSQRQALLARHLPG